MVQGQQTQHADQQMIFSQKVVVEATSIESTRSCKHCQKDFVHRGSLWRHQMFCDANPERDLNRIVAGSKKKPVVVKVLVLSISFSLSLFCSEIKKSSIKLNILCFSELWSQK